MNGKGKDANIYLNDILQAIRAIREYTAGLDRESLAKNRLVSDAVIHQLAIIGEAATGLPEAFRKVHPGIEWRKIVGMRNRLIHSYSEVDEGILWDVVKPISRNWKSASKPSVERIKERHRQGRCSRSPMMPGPFSGL